MNIICAGFGGQGVLTAGLILGKTAMDEDKNVTWIPSYGSEMRGGTANCNLKIDDGRIASPFIKDKDIDLLVVMNLPSVLKFEEQVKPGGTIIYNTSLIEHDFRDDVTVIGVDATTIANRLENPRGGNIVMLGGVAASGVLLDKETIEHGIERFFADKGQSNPKNKSCFQAGYDEHVKRGE